MSWVLSKHSIFSQGTSLLFFLSFCSYISLNWGIIIVTIHSQKSEEAYPMTNNTLKYENTNPAFVLKHLTEGSYLDSK